MNRMRRKELEKICDLIGEANERLEEVIDEETESRDNMPDSLQETEKYERMDEIVSNLEEALSNLEDALETIEDAKS